VTTVDPTSDVRKILSLNSPDLKGVGRKLGSHIIQTTTRWDPVTMNDGEIRRFRTGCPVFTDLWSYVSITSD
jgi:hypothetical protein